jgi:hypothetical protein
MLGRIEEGIDGRTAGRAKSAAASAPPPSREADDDATSWSFDDVVAFILDFVRHQPDPSPEPP